MHSTPVYSFLIASPPPPTPRPARHTGPYKSVSDVYNIPGLTPEGKNALKNAESRFVVLDVKPEYDIDKINNGLYR